VSSRSRKQGATTMNRVIVIDTETTGLDPDDGHRVVEIGALELIDGKRTGVMYQQYINPERSMPAGAQAVHGLSSEFLINYPAFHEIADEFLDFIEINEGLIFHNAAFDVMFIDDEMMRLGYYPMKFGEAICTKSMAWDAEPYSDTSLNALCAKFGIDTTHRQIHGAIKDCELTAKVYAKLRSLA
jgi:DNA polymerase III subunit epsilon